MYGTKPDRVTDFDGCEIAREASIPGNPLADEIKDCPAYKALNQK